MDVVKAFNTNQLHTEIVIKGTYFVPPKGVKEYIRNIHPLT